MIESSLENVGQLQSAAIMHFQNANKLFTISYKIINNMMLEIIFKKFIHIPSRLSIINYADIWFKISK